MFGGSGQGFEFHFGGGVGDIFSQFFGEGNPFGSHFQREEFRENLDVNISSTINLKQIYLNEALTLKFKRYVHCNDCNGTGFDKNSRSDTCEMCNGVGYRNGKTCEYCKGDGKVYTGQCNTCHGEKIILKDTEINLQNLFQIRQNLKNSHRGVGHQSKYYREKVGNLILNINIDRNDGYTIVNNYELHKSINVHFQDAIDGNDIKFKHIDDIELNVKLPKKTKDDDVIRIKGKGLLKNDNTRSDLYLKVNIIIDYNKL